MKTKIKYIVQLGSHKSLKESPTKFWTLLHWPASILDEAQLHDTLKTHFTETVRNFTAQHDLYVAFRNSKVVVSFHTGRDSKTLKQPFDGFWFYELYTINGDLVYNKVENLGSTIVKCEPCISQTIRRLNLQGLLLRFEGVVSFRKYNIHIRILFIRYGIKIYS